MKKVNRLIQIIVLTLCILFIGVFSVNAKTGETTTIDRKTYIQTGVGSRVEAKFHTTMGYGWCITPHKVGANQGAVLSYAREETDGGILYLLDKAGFSDMEYLKTQLALWSYQSNYLPAAYVNHSNASVVQAAKVLANQAAQNRNYKVNGPAITVNGGNVTVTMVKVGETYYYRTSAINVNVSGASTYTVSLTNAPAGAQILTTGGNVASTFKSGEQFIVRIPESSISGTTAISIKATATGVRKYVERYSPSNNALQDVVVLRSENRTATNNITLNVTPAKRTCQSFNGRYYGSNGQVVSYDEYKRQCIHTCTYYNGQYYGSDSKVVSYDDYKKQCVHTCTYYNGHYYGSDSKVVSYDDYKKQCVHTCTYYNGHYYGSNSKIVTEQEYKNQCVHTCTFYNGHYYGSNSKIVTEQEYKNQCVHTCTVYNGQYYGSNSQVVSYDEYRNQCIHTCTFYNGQYYGSNSKVVTEQEYKNQCIHTCTNYNGNYYGSNGQIVSEDEYKKQCLPTVTVPVPNTGSNSDSSNLVIGSLFVLGGMGITFGYRKGKNN